MKWTGEAPLISKSADWSGKENSWAEHGGVCTVITLLWKCVNECVCVCLVYPEPHWLIKQTRQSLQYLTCILLSRGSSDFCLYFTLMFSLTLTYGGVFKRNLIFFFFQILHSFHCAVWLSVWHLCIQRNMFLARYLLALKLAYVLVLSFCKSFSYFNQNSLGSISNNYYLKKLCIIYNYMLQTAVRTTRLIFILPYISSLLKDMIDDKINIYIYI